MTVTIDGTKGIVGASWATGGRPSSPAAGQRGFNTTLDVEEVYDGTQWQSMSDGFTATGGTITESGGYTIHTFNSSGTFTPAIAGAVEYLVVAGGGGGGGRTVGGAGGGGAGGFRTATGFAVAATGLTVTVGAGGAGGTSVGAGGKGSNSVFSSITSTGGGAGSGSAGTAGGNGGSGGATGDAGTVGSGNEGSYSPVEGYNGGLGKTDSSTYSYGGAGGGSSAVGTAADATCNAHGGAGTASSISGSSVTYAGGGGGAADARVASNGGNGGAGGGGAGGDGTLGVAGTPNTGGGAGGSNAGGTGGSGGSGIVIVRYPTASKAKLTSRSTITSGTAQVTRSGTSKDFTGIPAGVKRITVLYSGVSTNGTSIFLAQLGDSGGFETSGYTGRAVRNGPTNNIYSSAFGAGFLLSDSIAAANVYIGSIKLEHIGGEEWIASGSQNTLTAINEASQFNGAKTLSGVITQFRLTTVNGTDAFDAGSVNISWEF
jgi:hypothetical protein